MAVSRRTIPPVPTGQPPPIAHLWKLLLDLWKNLKDGHDGLPGPHQETHLVTGTDPLQTPGLPVHISLANVAETPSIGDGPSYARADHDHGDIKRDVRIKAAGSDVGTRNAVNFIQGAGITLTVSDNGGSDRVDVTVAATPTLSDDAEIMAFFLSRAS